MLKLKILSSGSSGNCYLLECNDEMLVLDCGLPIMEIKKGLNFDLSNVVGCVVTHAHKDHSLSVKDFENMGIRVWQPYLDENKVQRRYFGGFMVRGFDVPHDNEPCCGFLIGCSNGENFLYATDFEYIKYSFKKFRINHLLIEANYQKEYVQHSAENRSHVFRGHAELQTTLGIIKDNLSDSLRTIILCHLSHQNANAEEMVAEVKKVAKSGTYIDYARKGLEVELRTDGCPF